MSIIAQHFALTMSFPKHLSALRKERGFTQQQMADTLGIHVSQKTVIDSILLMHDARSYTHKATA